MEWLNQINLDLLRHSRWTFLLSPPATFSTTATPTGQTTSQNNKYWVGIAGTNPAGTVDAGANLADLDIIKRDSMIDYTNFKRLGYTELQPVAQEYTLPAKPRLWQQLSSSPQVITLWPAPVGIYTISFRYYKQRATLVNQTDLLQVPNRYRDILCYGVTWRAFQYLKSAEDIQQYGALYQAGKVQIIKDMNLFPRAEEFIHPDPSAVTRQTTTGIGLDSGLETSIP